MSRLGRRLSSRVRVAVFSGIPRFFGSTAVRLSKMYMATYTPSFHEASTSPGPAKEMQEKSACSRGRINIHKAARSDDKVNEYEKTLIRRHSTCRRIWIAVHLRSQMEDSCFQSWALLRPDPEDECSCEPHSGSLC